MVLGLRTQLTRSLVKTYFRAFESSVYVYFKADIANFYGAMNTSDKLFGERSFSWWKRVKNSPLY